MFSQRTFTVAAAVALGMVGTSRAADQPMTVDQGPRWTQAKRADFYTRDQGSEIMPLSWMRALKQSGGQPFLADALDRYGYLPNPDDEHGLPVGFTAAGPQGSEIVGMTCAACHTRQIEVGGKVYRIDGGPAISDFQGLLADLDRAVASVLVDDVVFAPFASVVLGPTGTSADVLALRQAVALWYERYHTLMERALPVQPWGPGRLDAVAMIFNRLTGLDLGTPPTFLIPDNIQLADAPVRYPFLWNAAIQDKTQWPGFADNGNDILGLSRNLGEVLGVFATFYPRKSNWQVLGIDYTGQNSANFDGLSRLERLVRDLGPPKWPWSIDPVLAAQGKAIFDRPNATDGSGGCVDCHGIAPGTVRFLNQETWLTRIQDVGTDSREYQILNRKVQTGVLEGARTPFNEPLKVRDQAFRVLETSVLGSIVQHIVPFVATVPNAAMPPAGSPQELMVPPRLKDLQGAFHEPAGAQPTAGAPGEAGPFKYEARVMQGIWATAPYLHNGSVPTLAELLKPAAERTAFFKIGTSYDIKNVGLATEQTKFNHVLATTDCATRDSGNSRCGHDFGTTLPEPDKRALLEYMKTL